MYVNSKMRAPRNGGRIKEKDERVNSNIHLMNCKKI
jgi:hypothetical protein